MHWVRRVALNTCLDRLRRQRARPEFRYSDLTESEQQLMRETPSEEVATEYQQGTAMELIERLLGCMSEKDAWLVRELDLRGKTIAEVCAETGWNAGVTRIRAFRARARLKSAKLRARAMAMRWASSPPSSWRARRAVTGRPPRAPTIGP